jgi:hypothetical protein
MKYKNYKKEYYNNEFNYLISQKCDGKRSIMDIDCFISKIGQKNSFIIDHKKHNDNISVNTLIQLSKFVDVQLNDRTKLKSFIIRSDINTEDKKTNTYSVVYELNNFKNVINKKIKKEYIKDYYTIRNDEDLKNFFQPETHEQTKLKLKEKL